jgi:predicted nucleic acid-binding protein
MIRPYQIVLDTNVLLAGLRSNRGASYKLLTILNDLRWQLNISTALIFEYEEILKPEKDQLTLTCFVVRKNHELLCHSDEGRI